MADHELSLQAEHNKMRVPRKTKRNMEMELS